MRLVRYGVLGEERPGLLGGDGALYDLSPHCRDIGPDILSDAGLASLAGLDIAALSQVAGSPRLGPPLAGAGKVVCVGPNYHSMSAESGTPVPEVPRVYMKAATAITGPGDPIRLPNWAKTTHWEAELAVVIGSLARAVAEEDALRHVAGYCILNDISDRETERAGGGESVKGRSFDGFGPMGPWLVTRDEIGDPHGLGIRTTISGALFQDGTTADMVFSVPRLVSYISRFMTLAPGDVISTGTPSGIGLKTDPPTFLKPGDTVEITIDGLGTQRNDVVSAEDRRS